MESVGNFGLEGSLTAEIVLVWLEGYIITVGAYQSMQNMISLWVPSF